MNINELEKLVELELQWLYYYSREDSKQNLNLESNIYEDLISIGYTKRPVKLDIRCCPCTITSDKIITEKTDISELFKSPINKRGENKLSPVEVYIKLFPDKKIDIINKLKNYWQDNC